MTSTKARSDDISPFPLLVLILRGAGEIQKKKALRIFFSVCLLACFRCSNTRWDDDMSLDADILAMSSMAKAGGRTDGWMDDMI
jgi:hypothetical protein